MEVKFNTATLQRPEGVRIMDAPLVGFDLFSFIEQIKKEKKWKETDRNAITVFKTNGLRIVLIALRKGAEMIKHTADGLISVQVLEGKMQLNTDDQSVKLGKGQMLALHKGIPHNLLAKKKTIFLLTLTTTLAENSNGGESLYNKLIF
jgi:quercetin dioxygenase-like cupin family protein